MSAQSDESATPAGEAEAFWEPHYVGSAPGTGGPNAVLRDLFRRATPVRPWTWAAAVVATRCGWPSAGWTVLTVDVSATALARVAQRASDAGLVGRVRTERHDLTATFPKGQFDLVSAQYLLSPVAFERPPVFARAAAAVRPGGMLLIVDHASVPPWSWADPGTVFPTPKQTLDSIGLDPEQWQTVRLEDADRDAAGPAGQRATVTDTIIGLVRRA